MNLASSIFENVDVEDNAPSIPSAMPTVFTSVETKAGESEIACPLHSFVCHPREGD